MNRSVRMGIAVGVIGVLGACGSDGDDESSPTTAAPGGISGAVSTNATVPLGKQACELLPQPDVVELLGNPVKEAVPAGDLNCTWGTDVDGGSSLDITVVKPSENGASQACKDQGRMLPSGVPRESVDGVGDSAEWVLESLTTIKQGHLLACWDDGVVVVLLTGEREPDVMRSTATAVAEMVHDRM